MRNEDGIALVTGASAGIGAAICRRLIEEGYRVAALSRRAPEFRHENLIAVNVDLADRRATREAVASLASQEQILRVVHNAGVIRPAPVEEAKAEDLDYLVELHLSAMLTIVQAALPTMKAAGFGRIVGISSRGALGLETRTNYSASKAGMIAMLRTWALELGKHGITSNCVAPGPVESEMFYDVIPSGSEREARLAASIPVRRIGKPEDVAHAVSYFLSPAASFVTGQTLFVCGGASIGSIVI